MVIEMKYIVFTIGHSSHSIEKFLELIQEHNITAICDIRSIPYSQYTPQFNRENLKKELIKREIIYLYMGKELGARSDNPQCYYNSQVQFDKLAKEPLFIKGLNRLVKGMQRYRIALLCVEKDPLMCHRTILVCRNLRTNDIGIQHILEDGTLEHHKDTEKRLMKLNKLEPDMFYSEQQCIEDAYDKQAKKIAHVDNEYLVRVG
jgi:uncharacterized protein (DUF488 family)